MLNNPFVLSSFKQFQKDLLGGLNHKSISFIAINRTILEHSYLSQVDKAEIFLPWDHGLRPKKLYVVPPIPVWVPNYE